MELAESRGIKEMDFNKGQCKIQEFRVYQAEEMQGENPSPSRMEKYVILHHDLDYLNRFCGGNV